MSTVIDWSKYGRRKREKPQVEINYQDDGTAHGATVTAVFPIEQLERVFELIKAQREYWKADGKDHG